MCSIFTDDMPIRAIPELCIPMMGVVSVRASRLNNVRNAPNSEISTWPSLADSCIAVYDFCGRNSFIARYRVSLCMVATQSGLLVQAAAVLTVRWSITCAAATVRYDLYTGQIPFFFPPFFDNHTTYTCEGIVFQCPQATSQFQTSWDTMLKKAVVLVKLMREIYWRYLLHERQNLGSSTTCFSWI